MHDRTSVCMYVTGESVKFNIKFHLKLLLTLVAGYGLIVKRCFQLYCSRIIQLRQMMLPARDFVFLLCDRKYATGTVIFLFKKKLFSDRYVYKM
jgi:hypothetical protein